MEGRRRVLQEAEADEGVAQQLEVLAEHGESPALVLVAAGVGGREVEALDFGVDGRVEAGEDFRVHVPSGLALK